MSSDNEGTDTAKSYTAVPTNDVQQGDSIGTKIGQGFSGAMKVIHGMGESIRGMAMDMADFGKGSGKSIAADGKAETQEGVKQVESSLGR